MAIKEFTIALNRPIVYVRSVQRVCVRACVRACVRTCVRRLNVSLLTCALHVRTLYACVDMHTHSMGHDAFTQTLVEAFPSIALKRLSTLDSTGTHIHAQIQVHMNIHTSVH